MSLTADSRISIGTGATSPALVVSINRTGVVVPRMDGPPEFVSGANRPQFDVVARYLPVGLAELHLLVALADTGDPEAAVGAAVDAAPDQADRDRLDATILGLVETDLFLPGATVPAHDAGLAPERGWRIDRPATSASSADADDALVCPVPVSFTVRPDGFGWLDHDGDLVAVLDPVDVLVAAAFEQGRPADEAFAAFVEAHGAGVCGAADFTRRTQALATAGVCRRFDPQPVADMREALQKRFQAFHESDQAVLGALQEEIDHQKRTGTRRVLAVPVDVDEIPPLSLGMVVAFSQAHDDGALAERLRFAPLWRTTVERVPALLAHLDDGPIVFLFSHYAWTSARNLEIAAQIKQALPQAITIHGGPSAPKYPDDATAWFANHPQVDVSVRGEGELTLAEALDALTTAWTADPTSPPDLAVLHDVAGLTYRTPDGVQRTADRDRMSDLDLVPSPYLTGVFDHLKRFHAPSLILETNRGCPYGCTFCDWGSATTSRIRKFDLERVKAEMEWAAERKLEFFMVADANFGMLDRDVEIVEWAVELKARYGAPSEFWVNYAKNKVGNLAKIVRILREGGIGTQCVASVQSFDETVLKTIRRSNIKIERYDALTDEFRLGSLPLHTDIMIGLPGATVASVRNDLQAAIDRELQVRALPLQLLVNSPMNDPEYRAENGIVAEPDQVVQETSTYDRDDWYEMMATRRFFYFAERDGILRQLATYTRASTGMREIDFYQLVRDTAAAERAAWPMLAWLVYVAADEYLPPGSWWPVIDELGRLMVERAGVADDDALTTVLGVQHALLPTRGRSLPEELELPHDYARWHADAMDAKLAHTDGTWPDHLAPLSSYPPGRFALADGDNSCELLMGQGSADAFVDVAWELDSPVNRPKEPRERAN